MGHVHLAFAVAKVGLFHNVRQRRCVIQVKVRDKQRINRTPVQVVDKWQRRQARMSRVNTGITYDCKTYRQRCDHAPLNVMTQQLRPTSWPAPSISMHSLSSLIGDSVSGTLSAIVMGTKGMRTKWRRKD